MLRRATTLSVNGTENFLLFACDYPNSGIWLRDSTRRESLLVYCEHHPLLTIVPRFVAAAVRLVISISGVASMSIIEDSRILLVHSETVSFSKRV